MFEVKRFVTAWYGVTRCKLPQFVTGDDGHTPLCTLQISKYLLVGVDDYFVVCQVLAHDWPCHLMDLLKLLAILGMSDRQL